MAESKRVKFQLETAFCGLCKENTEDAGGNNTAAAFCKTCQAFVCRTCLKPHRRLVVAENHRLINRDHNLIHRTEDTDRHPRVVPSVHIPEAAAIMEYEHYRARLVRKLSGEKLEDSPNIASNEAVDATGEKHDPDDSSNVEETQYNFTEPCSVHFGEMIKFFCQKHKQLCCNVCKMKKHRPCGKSVCFIPEAIENFESLKTPDSDIEEQIAEFKDFDRRLQQDFKELKKSKNVFLFDLKEKKKEILDWLNMMEVRAVRRVESVFDKSKKDIEKKRKNVKQACEELRAEAYFLKEILTSTTHDNTYKFIKMKQADQCLKKLKDKRDNRQFSNSRFGLRINKDFDKSRRMAEDLYEMKIESKCETKYSIRLKDDKRVADVTGCALLDGGEIVIADRNNRKVKFFNCHFKLINQVPVPNGVFDLTAVNNAAVAVTCPPKCQINIVDVLQEPGIAKTLHTGQGSCWGIKHHNGVFVVNCSVDNAYYVRAVDLDSNILFEVETKCSFASALSWKDNLKQLIISTATSYSDHIGEDNNFYLDELTQDGNNDFLVVEYNFLNHLHTKDVTLDGHGNLVVCCVDTSQIYTISQTGKAVELMLAETDGLDRPRALCYSRDRKTLLVTSEDTDFVQIFEYEQ